jgi:hypothetical protein
MFYYSQGANMDSSTIFQHKEHNSSKVYLPKVHRGQHRLLSRLKIQMIVVQKGRKGMNQLFQISIRAKGQSLNRNTTHTTFFSREEGTAYPGPNGVFLTLWDGWLFHHYLVDAWAIIGQSKLLWHRNNQAALRVELYTGLSDALLDDNLTRGAQVGQYILPSSYYGGHRQMAESYQDAMSIAQYLGEPQLFVTMTANPKWPEIQAALLPGQTYSD